MYAGAVAHRLKEKYKRIPEATETVATYNKSTK
jgi:hypothetical protein